MFQAFNKFPSLQELHTFPSFIHLKIASVPLQVIPFLDPVETKATLWLLFYQTELEQESTAKAFVSDLFW